MKQTLISIALLFMTLLATSSYNRDNAGLELGDYVPEMTVSSQDNNLSINNLRGEFVLLSFWRSSDAASRLQASQYSAWKEKHPTEDVRLVGVNFDLETALFAEIARRDGLDLTSQFNAQGEEAQRIIRDFRLDSGYGSLLIGPDGRIRAINPKTSELPALVR